MKVITYTCIAQICYFNHLAALMTIYTRMHTNTHTFLYYLLLALLQSALLQNNGGMFRPVTIP